MLEIYLQYKGAVLLCPLTQRQEMTASTETLNIATDSAPQALPYHSNTSTLRSADSPKREASEIYLKSKALLESRRKCLANRLTPLFDPLVLNSACHFDSVIILPHP